MTKREWKRKERSQRKQTKHGRNNIIYFSAYKGVQVGSRETHLLVQYALSDSLSPPLASEIQSNLERTMPVLKSAIPEMRDGEILKTSHDLSVKILAKCLAMRSGEIAVYGLDMDEALLSIRTDVNVLDKCLTRVGRILRSHFDLINGNEALYNAVYEYEAALVQAYTLIESVLAINSCLANPTPV